MLNACFWNLHPCVYCTCCFISKIPLWQEREQNDILHVISFVTCLGVHKIFFSSLGEEHCLDPIVPKILLRVTLLSKPLNHSFIPSIWKAISEYKIQLKSLNVLLRRSCHFVFFVAHVICTLNVLTNKMILVSATLNKIKRSFHVPFCFLKYFFYVEYLRNNVVNLV